MSAKDNIQQLPHLVVIDNYDSFTYNLVQMISALGADMKVFRNDEITVDEIVDMKPQGILVSPGPGTPDSAGISIDAVKRFSGVIPVLGVCLGHQSIAQAFGGQIIRAGRIMHGKTSDVTYDETPLYKGLKNPFAAGRYHSLAVKFDAIPAELIVDARTDDGEIMGMHHAEHPTYGVQFHPESVLTPSGKRLLRNFLNIIAAHSQQ